MNRFAAASGVALCAAMAAIPAAHAVDGRIVFLGHVVAPTCAPAAMADSRTHEVRAQCPNDPSSTHYTLHLEPAGTSRVQLIEYYDGYVHASGIGKTVWVATQTYE